MFAASPIDRTHAATPLRAALVAVVALAAGLVVAALPVRAQSPQIPVTDAQVRGLGVQTAAPVASVVDQTLAYPAQIVIPTAQLWVVSAPVAGMVATVTAARGDRVKRGDAVATLQSPNFVSLQREYLHALAQEVLLGQQVRRETALVNDHALAQRVLEATQTEARQASLAVAERRQMLRLSGMSDAAIARLKNEAAITAALAIAAPEDGTVVDVVVSPGVRLEQSAPMLKVARLSPLWAEISVPATSVGAIRPGARVDIDGYGVPGRVLLVSDTVDPTSQTVLVRAEFPNDGDLRPGKSAAARIGFLSPGEAAWEVPSTALVRRGEAAGVFVAVIGGFRFVPVSIVAEDQDHVVVSGDIRRSDKVAISGVSGLRGILLGLGAGE
jgi:membrane fusion protein, heavy metal efflux system